MRDERSAFGALGVDVVEQLHDAAKVAEELYLTVLTRHPDTEEVADVQKYLATHADQLAEAIAQLAWSLVASTEFSVNH